MNQQTAIRHTRLTTPRAAAVAGILFAAFFIASVGLMRLAIPEEVTATNTDDWLRHSADTVGFALTLVPFAGIAFLWFMGVVRAHLGRLEDQFFSTVFYGSGVLFLAMIFCSSALAGGLVSAYALAPELLDDGDVITFARTVIYTITNIYAIRMAGVFMLSLGTVWLRTRAMPRMFVLLTYLLALVLLIAINLSLWMIMIFPLWVLAVSLYILVVSLRDKTATDENGIGGVG